ncbi:MAG: SufS family cysteine desulfurase [Bacteroidales bacterium]|jgi:cysteine desulfurase/selenocysteine lyase|nr:SufS family cysteine desulfurase [Bacteroidales bacterium]
MTVPEIRALFPILDTPVYGKPLVYLDNAATAQRPQAVVDCWKELVEGANANIHRAVHHLAAQATDAYEGARNRVQSFINAAAREEIVFTSGATASINLVAFSYGQAFVNQGDEVVVSACEHHSNIVPWQMLCERKGATLRVLEPNADGRLDPETLSALLNEHTKIVAITHISNVLGLVNPVKELVAVAHKAGVPVLVDGAQGIVHEKVDVQDLDCDFYAFSGHKVYAATGTGVLYGKRKWLEAMPPYMGGGEMIETVRFSGTTYARLPMKFEAGTQNFNAAPTLVPALDFADAVRENPAVKAEQQAILDVVYKKLTEDQRIILYGTGKENKIPLFSFAVKGAHHEDLALILDKMGVAVRSGQMCAEPLMDHLGVTGLLRASFAPYNTVEEAQYFLKSLDKAIGMLV